MASRLKRRIPVIVSTRGAAAGSGSTAGVGSTAPVGPEWLIPVATYNLGTFAPGSSIPLTGLYTANGGTPYFSYVSGQTISGTPVTMTVDPTDGDITAPTTETTYTAIIDLDDDPAESDWVARSQGAGVVWAHDFRNAAEVSNFLNASAATYYTRVADGPTGYCLNVEVPTAGNYSVVTNMTRANPCVVTTSTAHGFVNGNTVSFWSLPSPFSALSPSFGTNGYTVTVLSSTSFSISVNTSAYGSAYNAASPGRTVKHLISQGGWKRPFAPLSSGNGLPSADINQPGLPTSVWDTGISANTRPYSVKTGFYGHSSYHGSGTYSGDTGSYSVASSDWHGTEYYLQFRVKQPYARFWSLDQPNGKLAFLDTTVNPGGICELVPSSQSHYRPAEGTDWDASRTYWPLSVTHPLLLGWYTGGSRAIAIRSSTFSPTLNSGISGERIQSGDEPYRSTCLADGSSLTSGACLWMPADEWVTFLIHVGLGRDNRQNEAGNNHAETVLEVWVNFQSEPGTYHKIYNCTDGRWSANATSGTAIPAHNALTFSGYMNEVPAAAGFYHRYTQVIFSTEFIAAPQA
jgi:hypothetical protein